MSPPSSRARHDDQKEDTDLAKFTAMLVQALGDERVSKVLYEYWTQAALQAAEETTARIQSLEQEVEAVHAKLSVANAAIDELEQYSRRNALRIWFPQPESHEDNTDKMVLDYANSIGVTLDPSEIGRSHRVGPPNRNRSKPRAIIVKFTTYNTRRRLYEARKKNQEVFVSEDLTHTRSRVFFNARLERKAGRFLHVWTRDGRINIRLHDNSIKVITTLADLDKLVDITPIKAETPTAANDPAEPQPSFADVVRSSPSGSQPI